MVAGGASCVYWVEGRIAGSLFYGAPVGRSSTEESLILSLFSASLLGMIDRLRKRWKREQERRRQRTENLDATKSILDRQNSGAISKWQASEEFDEQIMRATGGLVYYSDSTGLTAPWDSDIMLRSCL